jgi:hypothetical protein
LLGSAGPRGRAGQQRAGARARYTTAIAVFSLRSPGSATNYPLGNRRHACHEPSLLELSGVNTFAEIDDHVLAV